MIEFFNLGACKNIVVTQTRSRGRKPACSKLKLPAKACYQSPPQYEGIDPGDILAELECNSSDADHSKPPLGIRRNAAGIIPRHLEFEHSARRTVPPRSSSNRRKRVPMPARRRSGTPRAIGSRIHTGGRAQSETGRCICAQAIWPEETRNAHDSAIAGEVRGSSGKDRCSRDVRDQPTTRGYRLDAGVMLGREAMFGCCSEASHRRTR